MPKFARTRFFPAIAIALLSASASASDAPTTPTVSAARAKYELVLVEPSGRLRSRRQQFWLYGISLPRQMICRDAQGKAWGCGTNSYVEWSRVFAHGPVECVIKDAARNAWACLIDGKDVATALLVAGWGTRDPGIDDKRLIDAELAAKQARHGIWSSTGHS